MRIGRPVWLMMDDQALVEIGDHVIALAEGLHRAQFKVWVVYTGAQRLRLLAKYLDTRNIPFRSVEAKRGAVNDLMGRSRPDLVIPTGAIATVLARIAAKFHGAALMALMHPFARKADIPWGLRQLDRMVPGRIEMAIKTIDAPLEGEPEETGLLPAFAELPAQPPVPDGEARIAFVGAMTKAHGADLFCALAEHLPRARFEAYGVGPLRKRLEVQFGHRVAFNGLVYDMSSHWPVIGLVVLPRRSGPLPPRVLQAMGNGIPVATFDGADVRDVVAHDLSGWVLPEGDVQGLKDVVQNWSVSGVQKRLGYAFHARQAIFESRDMDSAISRFLDFVDAARTGVEAFALRVAVARETPSPLLDAGLLTERRMDLLTWRDGLLTGHGNLDQTHRHVLDVYNRVAQLMNGQGASSEIQQGLADFIEIYKAHDIIESRLADTLERAEGKMNRDYRIGVIREVDKILNALTQGGKMESARLAFNVLRYVVMEEITIHGGWARKAWRDGLKEAG